MVDADERVSEDLRAEVELLSCLDSADIALFRIRRKDMFFGQWLRRSSGYPTWFGRLARVGHVTVERKINEEFRTDGKVGFLKGHLIHYPFNKGVTYWLERHNRYSSMEAETLNEEIRRYVQWMGMFAKDPATRRKTLKQLAYRLPARPTLIFIYLYIVRMGFLDGKAGFVFCSLRKMYESMIDTKMLELRQHEKGLPV